MAVALDSKIEQVTPFYFYINMPSYIPPSKRKEEKPTLDPKTLTNEVAFPILSSSVSPKSVKLGFKEVIEERLRKEAEEAIRSTQPVDLWALSVEEREAQGYATLKVAGNTREEMRAIVERMHLRVYDSVEDDFY